VEPTHRDPDPERTPPPSTGRPPEARGRAAAFRRALDAQSTAHDQTISMPAITDAPTRPPELLGPLGPLAASQSADIVDSAEPQGQPGRPEQPPTVRSERPGRPHRGGGGGFRLGRLPTAVGISALLAGLGGLALILTDSALPSGPTAPSALPDNLASRPVAGGPAGSSASAPGSPSPHSSRSATATASATTSAPTPTPTPTTSGTATATSTPSAPTPTVTPTAVATVVNTTTGGTNSFAYNGTWGTAYGVSDLFQGSAHWSSTTGSTVTFVFIGSQVAVHGVKDVDQGISGFSIDGGPVAYVDDYSPTRIPEATLWSDSGLTFGPHRLTITVTGRKDQSSANDIVALGYAIIN
jgi:hypothetical protein